MPHMTDISVAGDIPDLDAIAASVREKANQTYNFKYLGRQWTARNSVPFGQLVAAFDESADLSAVLDMIVEFIAEDQREDFKKEVLASKDVSVAELSTVSEFFNSRVREAVGNAGS